MCQSSQVKKFTLNVQYRSYRGGQPKPLCYALAWLRLTSWGIRSSFFQRLAKRDLSTTRLYEFAEILIIATSTNNDSVVLLTLVGINVTAFKFSRGDGCNLCYVAYFVIDL